MNAQVERVLVEVRGAWRFRWMGMLVAWAVCIVGWTFVMTLPDKFKASARVFVDTRTTLSQVTQGIAVQPNVEGEIQRVRQALLSLPQLDKVARDADLYLAGATPQQRQRLLEGIRDRIDISSTGGGGGGASGLYVISFTDASREQSIRIVEKLLNNFLESTLGGKREGSEQAQRFLLQQVKEYEERLSASEQRLADFKKKNIGLVPGEAGDYFSRMQAAMEDVQKSEGALNVAVRRRDQLQRQLRGEQPLVAGGTAAANAAVAGSNSDTSARLRGAQQRLDELLLRYTDKHPDVLALKDTIAELEKRQQAEIEALRRGDLGAAAQSGLSANPVYQSLQLQLNQAEVEVVTIQTQLGEQRAKLASLRQLVNAAPQIEAEFQRLNRDYDVTKSQYQALLQQLDRTKLGDSAEQTGVVRFEVIDPPTASFKAVSPNRPLLIAAVLIAAFGAAGGVAFLLHQLKPVFATPHQLMEKTGLQVIGCVSRTWRAKHDAVRRRGLLVLGSVGAALVAVTVGVILVADPLASFVHRLIT